MIKSAGRLRALLARSLSLGVLLGALCSCIETKTPIITERDRTNVGDRITENQHTYERTANNLYSATGGARIAFRYVKNEGNSKLLLLQYETSSSFDLLLMRTDNQNTATLGNFSCDNPEISNLIKKYSLRQSRCDKSSFGLKIEEFDAASMECFLLDVIDRETKAVGWGNKMPVAGIRIDGPPRELRCGGKPSLDGAPIANSQLDGPRVALIIGNSAYKFMPALNNPKNDATDVDGALKSLGFDTVVATDLDRAGMNDALNRFSRKTAGASVAIVYYAGHGMQFSGKNYLLPTDANLNSAADVNRFELLPVEDLVDVLASAKGLQLIILDACRNNPVERDFKNKLASVAGGNRDGIVTRGFSRIEARGGLVVVFATSPNDVAADGSARNSPFTREFLKNVRSPDLEVRQMLNRVQSDVYASTKQQLPEIVSQYVGPEVILRPTTK